MSEICHEKISRFEILGRILNETSQINKSGMVKPQSMYPRLREDNDLTRRGFFTNKISMLRLCRGHEDWNFTWKIHAEQARQSIRGGNNIFRGFLIIKAYTILKYGFDVVEDGHENNPNHAHIIIPDYNVTFIEGVSMIAEVLPAAIRSRLDRLRMEMKAVFLNPGNKYSAECIVASPTDSICTHCSS